ncbi:hypothetical protein OROHE_010851 [Orobanche hederae]
MDNSVSSTTDDNGDDHHNFLPNLMKHYLLFGADKLLMARKPDFSISEPQIDNEFPLNFTALMIVVLLKLAGIHVSLIIRLFTFPVRLLSLSLMFLMFPFQFATHLKHHMKKMLMRACDASHTRLAAFVCSRLESCNSVLKLAVRFGKAVFSAAYVFFLLVGLLVSGFAIGGIVMRILVREPIHTTQTLNFDYTRTSPAAVVPIVPSLAKGMLLPSKLKLTVCLTLPESEYNRKLGIFQVRVESLSANGKVIFGSSYPTMLRFKSQPVRAVETLFKSVHLITGLKSEVQNLKIVMGEHNSEGYEPNASFKVVLEQRAEFQGGLGVPEIYDGSLEIKSELPKLKRALWKWRRTVFVWIGFGTFMAEMMVLFTFCRALFLPGSKSRKGC